MSPITTAQTPTAEARLKEFYEYAEKTGRDWKVPGFSIAIVRLAPSPLFVGDLDHWHFDTFRVKWHDSIVYPFPISSDFQLRPTQNPRVFSTRLSLLRHMLLS